MLAKNSLKRILALAVVLICFWIAGTAHAEMYTYDYHLRTYDQANPIRNLVIQLTDSTTVTNIWNNDAAAYSIGTFDSSVLQGFPLSSMYGINFSVAYNVGLHDFEISFQTTNAPVWGNAYARGWFFAGDDPENLAYAYNNTTLSTPVYIPVPDGGGVGVPISNWVGLITNIDNNNIGPFPTNADSTLYVYGDRWYYQANDWINGYHDYGWVELSWNITTTPVPEPATMLLLGSGLIGLAGFARKKFFKR